MKKKKSFRFALVTIIVICIMVVFGVCASATNGLNDKYQPDASFTIKELNIIPNYAVLEGQTYQMQVEDFDEFVVLNFLEWSSSNPAVISCTKNGEIKGLKEGKAIITVKAKVGNASDSVTVYCAKRLINSCSSRISNSFAWSCLTPSFFHIQTLHFNIFPLLMTEKLEVKGVYGSYFYVEFQRSEKQYKGFIRQSSMPDNIASREVFKQLSQYDLDIFVGVYKEKYRITTQYQGDVEWIISDTNIVTRDKDTGILTAHKPGTATLTAKAGDKTLTCTIHSIYLWPLQWTGAVLENTCVYKAQGYYFKETSRELAIGERFTVWGDMGGSDKDGWVYGVSEKGDWGYVPISHISNKNTISYYSGLGWSWPLQNKEYNYVNSPHAPRPSLNDEHRGFDINENDDPTINQPDIEGQKIVAAFDGVVKKVGADLDPQKGCGYYICITSNTIDPVTNKKLIAIYQHMQSWALFSQNDTVKKGEVIGYVGNTGYSKGSHLHFEVNNWNAGIGDSGRSDFAHTINPIYFYMDLVKSKAIKLNMDCSAVNSGFSFYYYGYSPEDDE